jgi:hypothetical protein
MSGLFSSPPPPPKPQKPPPMPDEESPAVKEAKRRAALDMLQRAGRESTILTSREERTGGDYSRKTLGGN